MHLREDQIELLERIEPGLVWEWHIDPESDSRLLYLRDLGLVQAREDIKHNLLCLTELGKSLLEHERQKLREQAEQNRKEETAEAARLQELRKDTEELQKLRQDIDEYRSDDAPDKSTAEHRPELPERRSFLCNVFPGVVATVIGGIIVYYWPDIISTIHLLLDLLRSTI